MSQILRDIEDVARSGGSAAALAAALDWGGADVETIAGPAGFPIDVAKTIVSGQPAALFAVGHDRPDPDLVELAAGLAYHSTIHWGVVLGPTSLTVFNSHWVSDQRWYQLPSTVADRIDTQRELFEALTPEGVIAGDIDRVAQNMRPVDRLLQPVDDALVNRLDHWRGEALRHAPDPETIDGDLQTLFAQMFILRAVEDRALAPDLTPIETVLGARASRKALDEIFAQAERTIQSELFHERVTHAVPWLVVEGVIRDLYYPENLPMPGARYNFGWIEADVLGRAYEKYLSTLLVPARLRDSQLRLFDQPLRSVDRVSVQKAQGVYYTPSFLVRYITERALDDAGVHVHVDRQAVQLPRVADFACGSGSFLTVAADILLKRLRLADPNRNWARELVEERRLVGIDNDPRAVTLARLALWLRFAEEPNPLPLPALAETVVLGDALGEAVWTGLPTTYDVVLGNPPFLATGAIADYEELKSRFTAASGRFDYSYLFLELAIRKLGDGGVLGMVLPNRLSANRDATALRKLVAETCILRTVVDFGSEEIFLGTKAHILVLLAQRTGEPVSGSLRVIEVRDLPERFPGVYLYRADKGAAEERGAFLRAHMAAQPRSGAPWLLLSRSDRAIRIALENMGPLLGDVADVWQGIKTGANDLFIVHVLHDAGAGLVEVENGLGEQLVLEKTFLRPMVFGSDIQRYEALRSGRFLIYPYPDENIPATDDLQANAPLTWKYLRQNQDLLASRASLVGTGKEWFELIRQRDVAWLNQPKCLTKDLIVSPSFAADEGGEYFLVGGTAVVPPDPEAVLPLLGFLNSAVAGWYLATTLPSFRTGYRKLEPRHLEALPIPEVLLADSEARTRLAELVEARLSFETGDLAAAIELEGRIDQGITDLTGVSV